MRGVVLVIATVVVVAACGSSRVTAPVIVLTLSGPDSVQGHDTTTNGQAGYVCHFPMALTTSGGAEGETATFDSAGYQVQVTNGLSYSGDLQNDNFFYPHAGVTSGDTLVENFSVVAAGPFQFSAILYYSGPQADTGSTAYTAACD
jgi:hypothetical protein